MAERMERMKNSAPSYYGDGYEQVQNATAVDLDNEETRQADLQDQLYIDRATWGLRYWEKSLGIPTYESDSLEVRRSRIKAARRGLGNFSAKMIRNISEAFSNGETAVTVDIAAGQITVEFIGARGLPPNIQDLKARLADIVHAHLELLYLYNYFTWEQNDAKNWDWATVDAGGYTWQDFERLE